MIKWLYCSVTLNCFAYVSFISLAFFLKPTIKYLLQGGTAAADYIGFCIAPKSLLFSICVLICYLIELVFYLLFKKFSFSFPYKKIQNKMLHYIVFYIGLVWGNAFLICFIIVLLLSPIFSLFGVYLG